MKKTTLAAALFVLAAGEAGDAGAQNNHYRGYPCTVQHGPQNGVDYLTVQLNTDPHCKGTRVGFFSIVHNPSQPTGKGNYTKESFQFHMDKLVSNPWQFVHANIDPATGATTSILYVMY